VVVRYFIGRVVTFLTVHVSQSRFHTPLCRRPSPAFSPSTLPLSDRAMLRELRAYEALDLAERTSRENLEFKGGGCPAPVGS
jgi:hypothetical protein